MTGGTESMIQYELWSANNDETKDETDSELLSNIWEYNREDCFSLIDLVDWMRSEQIKNGFAYENLYEEEKSSVVEFITQEINSKYSIKKSNLVATLVGLMFIPSKRSQAFMVEIF